jgi:hypothetical protein
VISVFAALCAIESAVAVNPDLRLNAVRDRFYKAIKGTPPYINRRIATQVVSYDEIVAWCRTFLKVKPTKVLRLSKVTRKAVKDSGFSAVHRFHTGDCVYLLPRKVVDLGLHGFEAREIPSVRVLPRIRSIQL